MVTYAAYAGADVDLRKVAIVTILGDTASRRALTRRADPGSCS
jgi:hypothetical protein